MMKAAILIPVYNNLDFTKKSVVGLLEVQKETINGEIKIIVIDDGSSDGTYQWLKQNTPQIEVLQGNGNLWWSGAINMGAKYAIEKLNVDYIVLWNNDISFDENYFKNLFDLVDKTNRNTIIGSKILVKEKPDYVWSMGGRFNPRNGKYDMYGYYQKDGEQYKQVKNVDWLTGMGTIIPAEIVKKISYWNEKAFPQYHGDSDFTYRAKLAGYNIIVNPALILYNNTRTSGVEHRGSFKQLLRLTTDIKSKSNLSKNLKFYGLYSKSYLAYFALFKHYFKIFGGFFKWKLLNLAGVKKKHIA